MQSSLKQCSAFVLAALAAMGAQADTMVVNANGYTLNAKGELVQFAALAFNDAGKIVAVGSAAEVAAKAPGARRVDLQGKTVLPGLIDAHGHVFGLGQMLTQLDLSQTSSLDGALKAIADYACANPGQGWLRGRGWNQENWKLGRFPTALDVDAVVSDRPVWFERVDRAACEDAAELPACRGHRRL